MTRLSRLISSSRMRSIFSYWNPFIMSCRETFAVSLSSTWISSNISLVQRFASSSLLSWCDICFLLATRIERKSINLLNRWILWRYIPTLQYFNLHPNFTKWLYGSIGLALNFRNWVDAGSNLPKFLLRVSLFTHSAGVSTKSTWLPNNCKIAITPESLCAFKSYK